MSQGGKTESLPVETLIIDNAHIGIWVDIEPAGCVAVLQPEDSGIVSEYLFSTDNADEPVGFVDYGQTPHLVGMEQVDKRHVRCSVFCTEEPSSYP